MPHSTPLDPEDPSAPATAPRKRKIKWGPKHIIYALIIGACLGVLFAWLTSGPSGSKQSPVAASTSAPTPAPPSRSFSSGSPAPSDSGSASVSASPSPTATPTPTPQCVAQTPQSYQLTAPLRYPANTPDSMNELAALRNSAYTDVAYGGAFVPSSDLAQWIDTAHCNGFNVDVDLDPVFEHFGADFDAARAYITSIAGRPGLAGYTINMNEVQPDPVGDHGSPGSANINREYAVIKSASMLPVTSVLDFNNTDDPSEGKALTEAYHTDVHLIAYFQWERSRSYGPVDAYSKVGTLAVSLDGTNAEAAVQGFGWFESDPARAQTFGFTAGSRPSAGQVGIFAQMIRLGGVRKILVDTQGPSANETPYLIEVGAAVAKVIG